MFDRRQVCVVCLTTFFSVVPAAWGQSDQSDSAGQTGKGTSQSQTQTSSGQTGQTGQSETGMSGDVNWNDARYSRGEIRQVQEALKNKGFDPGPVDGRMGLKTKTALREFQKQNNLTVVGAINNDTLKALGVWEGPLQARNQRMGSTSETTSGQSSSMSGQSSTTGQSSTAGQTTPSGQSSTSGQSSSTTSGQSRVTTGGTREGKETDQAELARKAADVLRDITQAPDKSIPIEMLEEAKGIAVIPNVIKGAFIVGGRWGEGLMLGRGADGSWNRNPAFIEIGGASVGFQAGVESTDLILVFASKDAIDALLDGKLELGGEAAVAAGPVGRQAGAGTDVKLSGPIYSYSRNKGVFAGVSLDGAVISIDDSANQKVYGQGTTGTQLLKGEIPAQASSQAASIVQPFVEAVRTNTGARAE
ncbi:MAG: YSC84-related protein [Acidobacteriota bacterium]